MDLEERFNLDSDKIQEEKLYLTDVIPDEYADFVMKYVKERAEGFGDIQILGFEDTQKKYRCLLLCNDNSPDLYFRSKGIDCEKIYRIWKNSDLGHFIKEYTIQTKTLGAILIIAEEMLIELLGMRNVDKIIDILENKSVKRPLGWTGGQF